MTQAARERLAMEARLRRALDLGHMRLHYQPQIDLATGRLMGRKPWCAGWTPGTA